MKPYLKIFSEKKWLATIILGTLAFSLILIFTLNLTLAFFSLIMFSSLGIFQRSFHYGLVFFLAVILFALPDKPKTGVSISSSLSLNPINCRASSGIFTLGE